MRPGCYLERARGTSPWGAGRALGLLHGVRARGEASAHRSCGQGRGREERRHPGASGHRAGGDGGDAEGSSTASCEGGVLRKALRHTEPGSESAPGAAVL